MADPTQADPMQSGGLFGAGPSQGGGLFGMDKGLLLNLGLGLLQAGGKNLAGQGNVGTALMGGLQNYYSQKEAQQKIGMGNLQMQQLQQEMPGRMNYLKWLGQKLHVANNDPGLTQQLQSTGLMGAPQTRASAPPSLMSASANAPPQPSAAPAASPSAMQQQGDDPMELMQGAAFGGALGMPGTQGLQELAKTQLQYDPAMATRMDAAKSPLAVDQYMIRQAQASGNNLASRAAMTKYLSDAKLFDVSARNGALSTFGGITPTDLGYGSVNPSEGTQFRNGNMTALPGAANALGTVKGATAAAEQRGRAAFTPMNVQDPNKPGASIPMSELSVLSNNSGQGAPSGVGGAAAAAAPGTPGRPTAGAPLYSTVPTKTQAYESATGESNAKYLQELQTQSDAARSTGYSIDNMLADAKNVQLGAMAPARQWFETHMSGIAQQFGIEPPKELADYQAIQKYANKVAFAATRELGSREAAQIVQLQVQSNPNIALTPQAFQDIALSMKAMTNYTTAKNTALHEAAQATQGNSETLNAQWTQKIDPRVWDLPLSPQMGQKWSTIIGPQKIAAAFQYLQPDEQIAAIRNMTAPVRARVAKLLPPDILQSVTAYHAAGQ